MAVTEESVKCWNFGQMDMPAAPTSDDGGITKLLRQIRAGDRSAESRLMEAIYPELNRLAQHVLVRETPGHSLEPTMLIGDVWLKIVRNGSKEWTDRAHFFRAAVKTMRHVLVDYARARHAQRRPKRQDRLPLEDVVVCTEDRLPEILEVHDALEQLQQKHPQAAEVVEMRYYGGYTLPEISEYLGIALTTVKNKHELAMAWLDACLRGDVVD
jgi:RNA polymerase sigma factor (TIGR02999 family)